MTPSIIIDLLPGHEGYAVSLSKHAGMLIYGCMKNETFDNTYASKMFMLNYSTAN